MIRVRYIIAALAALVALNIAWQLYQTWREPSPREFAPTSYSGMAAGYRALYELLDTLGPAPERGITPPSLQVDRDTRLLLLEPQLMALELEKAYLKELEDWLEGGGELVLLTPRLVNRMFRDAPALRKRSDESEDSDGEEDEEDEVTVQERLRRMTHAQALEMIGAPKMPERFGLTGLAMEGEWTPFAPFDAEFIPMTPGFHMPELYELYRPSMGAYDVRFTGAWEHLEADVRELTLTRNDIPHITGEGLDRALAAIEVRPKGAADETEWSTVGAKFPKGSGAVTLISDPLMLRNQGLIETDNAVLGYHLAAGPNQRRPLLDEYYKGALEQGNPFVLLGLHPYGVMALGAVAASALLAWRLGVSFGPPKPPPPPSRRHIRDYVDAMARLFFRGQKHRFVVETCRAGVLDQLREELHLAHGVSEGSILGRLARRDPKRAEMLNEALDQSREALGTLPPARAEQREIPLWKVHELQEKFEACLPKPAPSPDQTRPISQPSTKGR